jgi:uncharacterized membrane protein YdjX (TVP38/TMEM64 family)/membrane-associated phospholipid phosphatase
LLPPKAPSLSPVGLALAGWSAFLLAGLLFLALAWSVTARSSLVALDESVSQWLHAHASPALVAFFLAVTHLNSTFGIAVWSAAFAAVLARLREKYWMLTLALAVGGGMLLNLLLKAAYERMRPRFDLPVLELESFSFPSGHTAAAVLFYGVLAAFLVSRTRERAKRVACVAVAVAAVVLVAFSRVYLGAHFLSDVVAAACSSIAWLALCLSAGHALVRRRLRLRWILAGVVGLVTAACAVILPLEDWSGELQHMLEEQGPVTGLLVFCAANVLGTLLLVPAWIFPLVAGAALGFGWGLAASLAGAAASALAAFLIARYLARGRIERRVSRHPAFAPVNEAVKRKPWTTVALMRMSPVLPSGMKSYCFGLMQLDTWTYLGASLAGMLPGILLKVYVGAAGRDALASGGAGKWALFAAGIGATVALAWMMKRVVTERHLLGKETFNGGIR